MPDTQVFFSIIIPTRNRPDLFLSALDSVKSQAFESKEIIVVNDGSTGPDLDRYKEIEAAHPDVRWHYLPHRPNGHGQSYAMNVGADLAAGAYVGFLDDDDVWTDTGHLRRAHDHISEYGHETDLYYTQQKAYFPGDRLNTQPGWLADLIPLAQNNQAPFKDAYAVNADFLLQSQGFAHLNCSIFRKTFYMRINGMDEGIRYECDRDIFIRAIDAAHHILFSPAYVSKHHIPDPDAGGNMSTMVSFYQKKLFQLTVFNKGMLLCERPAVRKACRKGRGYILKYLAEHLHRHGRTGTALTCAVQAMAALPTVKWGLFTLALLFKHLAAPAKKQQDLK